MATRSKKKDQNGLSQNQDLDAKTPRVVPDSELQRPPIHSSPDSPKSSPKENSSHSDELNISSEANSDDSSSKTHSPSEKLYSDLKDEPRRLPNESRAKDSPTPKKDSPKKLDDEHQHEAQLRSCSIYKAIFCVVGLLMAFFLYNKGFLKSEPQKDDVTANVIRRLEKDFANQPNNSMIIIKKSLCKVINTDEEPKSPAIILFVSSKGAEKTTNCLVHRLAKEVIETTDESSDVNNVDGQSFKKMGPDETKKKIDDQLDKGVSSPERLNVFLIENIDDIPGEAALIMQKYCDHEDAQYKKAVVMMTISANDDIPKNVTRKEMNVIARSRLTHTWVDLKSDQFDPLYTRISGFISLVLREPNLSKC